MRELTLRKVDDRQSTLLMSFDEISFCWTDPRIRINPNLTLEAAPYVVLGNQVDTIWKPHIYLDYVKAPLKDTLSDSGEHWTVGVWKSLEKFHQFQIQLQWLLLE